MACRAHRLILEHYLAAIGTPRHLSGYFYSAARTGFCLVAHLVTALWAFYYRHDLIVFIFNV
jgi:hypothetical protein